MTVMVKKIGGSVAVVIPKGIAREMGLTDGVPLEVTTSSDAIIMRRRARRPRRDLDSIVRQIKSSSYRKRRHELLEPAVGKELW